MPANVPPKPADGAAHVVSSGTSAQLMFQLATLADQLVTLTRLSVPESVLPELLLPELIA